MSVTLTIPGRPIPAVRMTRGGKYVRADKARTDAARARAARIERHMAHRDAIAWTAKAAGVVPLDGPVRLSATFRWSPKGHRGARPDLDNLLKLSLDGLRGIAWHDDRQVMEYGRCRIELVAPEEQETELLIEPLEVSA